MDADGEDRPEDVSRLAAAWSEDTNRIVVAQRGERSEGLAFRFFYAIYKLTFRIMTGQKIDFGNFCLLPRESLRALNVQSVYLEQSGCRDHSIADPSYGNPCRSRGSPGGQIPDEL